MRQRRWALDPALFRRFRRGTEAFDRIHVHGKGSQYPGMGAGLYEHEPVFRYHVMNVLNC